MTITTTLNRIRAHHPCAEGWRKLLAHLGKTEADDEPLPFATIVASNGLDDAIWCCRAEPQHAMEWRLFAVWCARRVQPADADPRSLAALDVAERYANGNASDEELRLAAAAAAAAAAATVATAEAAAETVATVATAWATVATAWATVATAWEAAEAAASVCGASAAERAAQTARFLEVVS